MCCSVLSGWEWPQTATEETQKTVSLWSKGFLSHLERNGWQWRLKVLYFQHTDHRLINSVSNTWACQTNTAVWAVIHIQYTFTHLYSGHFIHFLKSQFGWMQTAQMVIMRPTRGVSITHPWREHRHRLPSSCCVVSTAHSSSAAAWSSLLPWIRISLKTWTDFSDFPLLCQPVSHSVRFVFLWLHISQQQESKSGLRLSD